MTEDERCVGKGRVSLRGHKYGNVRWNRGLIRSMIVMMFMLMLSISHGLRVGDHASVARRERRVREREKMDASMSTKEMKEMRSRLDAMTETLIQRRSKQLLRRRVRSAMNAIDDDHQKEKEESSTVESRKVDSGDANLTRKDLTPPEKDQPEKEQPPADASLPRGKDETVARFAQVETRTEAETEAKTETKTETETNEKEKTEVKAGGEPWWLNPPPWWMPPPDQWGAFPRSMYTSEYGPPVHPQYGAPSTPVYRPMPVVAGPAVLGHYY